MWLFWESTIKPILETLDPRVVVRVGTRSAEATNLLLEHLSDQDSVVHVVEPGPGSPSLDALDPLEGIELALMDGERNWYTVFHELSLLDRKAEEEGRGFPVCLVHDVDWPYGRRDLYSAPDTIPEEYLHPSRRGGLRQEDPEPGDGGFNREGVHAIREGGERNGVRTAIEDFLAATSRDLEFFDVPGHHGLGILAPAATLSSHPDLCRFPERLRSSPRLRETIAAIESERVAAIVAQGDAAAELDAARTRLATREAEVEAARAKLDGGQTQGERLRNKWEIGKASLSRLQDAHDRSERLRIEAERKLASREEEVAALGRAMAELGDRLEVDSRRADRNQWAKDGLEGRVKELQGSQGELEGEKRALEASKRELGDRNRALEAKLADLEAGGVERERQEAELLELKESLAGAQLRIEALQEAEEVTLHDAEKALERAEQRMSDAQRDFRHSDRLRGVAEERVRELQKAKLAHEAQIETLQSDLEATREGQLRERDAIATELRRIVESRSWRAAHAMLRSLRTLTFRRSGPQGAPELLADRLERELEEGSVTTTSEDHGVNGHALPRD